MFLKEIRKSWKDRPILFLLDEPENGLDCAGQKKLKNTISKYFSNEKDTALIVTNSPFLIYTDFPRINIEDTKKPFEVKYERKRIKIG